MKTEIINNNKIKCYDDGGKTFDRYTIVYLKELSYLSNKLYEARVMNANPLSNFSFSSLTTARIGRHLGKRIKFKDLPELCQQCVEQDILIK